MSHDLPVQVIKILAHRRQRFQHYLWYRLREGWLRLTPKEQSAICNINPLWAPQRPAVDARNRSNRENGSGEDFLFMASEITAIVNDLLLRTNIVGPRLVQGWKHLPDPSDEEYPVPQFPGSGLEELKTAEYYDRYLAPWERKLTCPDYLRNVNLGQLGCDIEFAVYRNVHMRWAAPSPVGYRPTTTIIPRIGEEWDSSAYDYLGDTYSSLVNPIFWKLSGWVNDRVEDWKRAHALELIVWGHAWIGDFKRHSPFQETADAIDSELLSIDRIISQSSAGNIDGFYRPTRVDGLEP